MLSKSQNRNTFYKDKRNTKAAACVVHAVGVGVGVCVGVGVGVGVCACVCVCVCACLQSRRQLCQGCGLGGREVGGIKLLQARAGPAPLATASEYLGRFCRTQAPGDVEVQVVCVRTGAECRGTSEEEGVKRYK